MKRAPKGLSPDIAGILDQVVEVYEGLAGRPVNRDCQGRTTCCRFRLTGQTPFLTRGEALVAARAWKSTGRQLPPEAPDGSCPLVGKDGLCTVYASRPFGCRTHFCKAAGGPISRTDVLALIRRLEELELKIEPRHDGPMPMGRAVQWALDFLNGGRRS